MTNQFRVLYREFLFRMIDLDMLSAQGDAGRLFGQFAGLLVYFSSMLGLGAFFFDARRMTPEKLLLTNWGTEHFLISTTMLVVGLFAVLSWDSTFLDRRDVFVLAPLPISGRTLFLAKVAASAAALSITVAALNVGTGLTWPMIFMPVGSGFLGLLRCYAAYWIAMFAAGAFIFCSVLVVQGLAAQLPRRRFLRLSAFLQMGAFCLFLCVYFLQPSLASPRALAAAGNQRLLATLPSYWFWGMFQALNGSTARQPAIALLVRRAWTGLALAAFGAAAAFLLSYFRTLRKIVEEPDIVPAARGFAWPLPFGNSLATAVVLFSARTLVRSRQHRLILAFYLGLGFTMVIFLMKALLAQQERLGASTGVLSHQANAPLLASTVVMMSAWVFGVRIVFAMPLELRANWIFRVTSVRKTAEYLAASRRPLFVLAVAPVWLGSAALLCSIWPWRAVLQHLVVLGLWGMILAYASLYGFQKIPFTCSYLPGKSNMTFAFLGFWVYVNLVAGGANLERRALDRPASFAAMAALLAAAALCVRWRTIARAKSEESEVQFEETMPPAILVLGLNRDGVVPLR